MYYHSGPTSTPFPDVPAFPTPPQPAYLRPPPAYLPPPAPGYPGHASGSCWPPTPGFLPLVTARAGRAAGGPAACRARLGSAGSSQSLSTDDSEEDGAREATYTHLTRNPVSDLARSTKGASKHRRDLINTEISSLRDILPLPESARQRLSQLQIMSLACCYIRKCNYFTRLFGNTRSYQSEAPFEFSQAMTGFLLITTREGKLLYISDNVTEYLGHSMVDMMTQGDSLYDIIDKRDHATVQNELLQSNYTPTVGEERTFFCRMNVSRSFRRHAGFGDHKVMHVRGHFIQPLVGDHYGSQPVFMASCTPLVTPDVKETTMQHNTLMFQSVHGLDMSYIEIAPNAEFHLGYTDAEMKGKSWYGLLHPEDIHEAKEKHIQLVKSSHEMGCMLTVRLQASTGDWVWVNMVMHIRQPFVCDNGDPAIVCNNHVISESEAPHFKVQSQLYSSHIARSPEFLGAPGGASPPHAITQVSATSSADRDSMGYQGPEEVTYHADFNVIPTTPSMGDSNQGYGTMSTSGQRGSSSSMMEADQGQRSPQQNQPPQPQLDQKQLLRQDIINRLKRKMQSEECKPTKQPRLSVSENRDNHDNGGFTIHGSVFTAPIMFEQMGQSGGFGGSVLGPISVHSGPVFSQLNIKKEVIVPESPKINPKMATTMVDLNQPMTPLTPESMTSDTQDGVSSTMGLLTSGQLSVDTSDSVAVVPTSLLTPDSSPACSPVHTGSKEQCVPTLNDLDNLSFFPDLDMHQPEKKPSVEQLNLPELDLLGLESYFTTVQEPLLAGLVRPTKQHPNPQSRIAEIAAALKESEHQHNLLLRQATSANPSSQTARGPRTSSIPMMVEALNQGDSTTSNSLVNSVTEALLDLARSHENLTLADITGNFMLVPECGVGAHSPADAASDDALLTSCLDVNALSDGAASPLSGDMEFQQLDDFTSNSPSHGDVDQLSKAVFDSTL